MIRRATLDDFPALYAVGDELRARSPTYRTVPLERARSLRTLANCINDSRGFAWVACKSAQDEPDGLLLGIAEPMWWCNERYATDLVFFASRPWDYVMLLRQFLHWAHTVPRVVEVTMGVSAGINPDQLRHVYKRCGLQTLGGLYTLSLAPIPQRMVGS